MFEEAIRDGIHNIFSKLELDSEMLYFFENIAESNLKHKEIDDVLSIITEGELSVLSPAEEDAIVYNLHPVFDTGYVLVDKKNGITEGFFVKDDNCYIFHSNKQKVLVASFDMDRFENHCNNTINFANPVDVASDSEFIADKAWDLDKKDQYFGVNFEAMVKYICGGDVKHRTKVLY